MGECLVNGQISAFVGVADRGLNYGDGLFETIAVARGRVRWWQDHIDRLTAGCGRLGLAMPEQVVLLREVQTVIAGQDRCIAKIVLTRGYSGRGYMPMEEAVPVRVVSLHPWPEGLERAALEGIETRVCSLRLAVQPALGGMKHLNRLEQVLAAREVAVLGADEGILRDTEGHIISAVSGNLFIVGGGQLLTPRLDRNGVRGILRGRILKAFKSRSEVRRISWDMLAEASEVFICNVVRGIVPVRRIDELRFEVGPVTCELQEWLRDSQEQQ